MISPTRAAAALGAAAIIVISAPVAHADETYPPSTPTPTVSELTESTPPVVEESTVSQGGALPRTGTDVLGWSLGGAALLAAGGALVVVARRRGQHA